MVGNGLHEDVYIQNHSTTPENFTLSFSFESDFADVFEVRSGSVHKSGNIKLLRRGKNEIYEYQRDHFRRQMKITVSHSSSFRRKWLRHLPEIAAEENLENLRQRSSINKYVSAIQNACPIFWNHLSENTSATVPGICSRKRRGPSLNHLPSRRSTREMFLCSKHTIKRFTT